MCEKSLPKAPNAKCQISVKGRLLYLYSSYPFTSIPIYYYNIIRGAHFSYFLFGVQLFGEVQRTRHKEGLFLHNPALFSNKERLLNYLNYHSKKTFKYIENNLIIVCVYRNYFVNLQRKRRSPHSLMLGAQHKHKINIRT